MSKAKANERREKLDQVRREQESADRRRNLLFGGIGGVLAILIIGGSVVAVQRTEANKPENRDLASFGVSASDAGCGDALTKASSDVNNHVQPTQADGSPTVVKYATVPPTFGPHYGSPAPFERAFYDERDRPAMETLVHNLEHGYVVVWYDAGISADEREDIEGTVTRLRAEAETQKIIASAWDPAYGKLPEDTKVALAHWGTKEGVRQLCTGVSGQAIGDFAREYPASGSPEPFGV